MKLEEGTTINARLNQAIPYSRPYIYILSWLRIKQTLFIDVHHPKPNPANPQGEFLES
jgi:hypothetical protein